MKVQIQNHFIDPPHFSLSRSICISLHVDILIHKIHIPQPLFHEQQLEICITL